MDPATLNLVLHGGNYAACTLLPRAVTVKIYDNAAAQAREKEKPNKEADVAWKMFGIVGGAGAVGLAIAGKHATGGELAMVNGAVAFCNLAAAGLTLKHDFMKDDMRQELRLSILGLGLGIGAYAATECVKTLIRK
mmetsp:Transcript_39185/g.97070  ORF Transcript_39185/g.97070 Transcript_39185/m.97070 type:complete len:136 (+) Transcript_39185:291-698(+)